MVLPAVVLVWLVLALIRSRRAWRGAVVSALGAAVLVTALYGVIRHEATGRWSAIVAGGSGWTLYARTAQFADCRQFRPPAGTARLCETTPPDKRPGPGYYLWLGGPGRAAFISPDLHDGLLKRFAVAAIVNQPVDYLDTVWTDLRRYVNPNVGPARADDFAGVETLNFPVRGPTIDPEARGQVLSYYGGFRPPSAAAVRRLYDYQRVFRVTGPLLFAFFLLSVAAVPLTRGTRRWGVLLLFGSATVLLLIPAMFLQAEWRYAMPALGPMAAVGAIGGWAIVARLAALRSTRGAVRRSAQTAA
jgi:hypothetical protein